MKMDLNDRKFQLQSQLHEQYAQNFNSHVGAFVSILGVIFVVFTALGYVYAHSSIRSWNVVVENGEYTLHHYFLLSAMVSGILYFLSYLCVMFSYIERRDQRINKYIRDLYHVNTGYENPNNLNESEFMPEFYKAFFKMLLFSQVFVVLMNVSKILLNIFPVEDKVWTWWGILPIVILSVSVYLIARSVKSKKKFYDRFKNKKN